MMEFYNDAVHKATKNHKCDLCGHLIPKTVRGRSEEIRR
jgi:hypothetical protein